MDMDHKAERTAKFNKNKKSRNRQKSKKYAKEKRENNYDIKNTGVSRGPNRPE